MLTYEKINKDKMADELTLPRNSIDILPLNNGT